MALNTFDTVLTNFTIYISLQHISVSKLNKLRIGIIKAKLTSQRSTKVKEKIITLKEKCPLLEVEYRETKQECFGTSRIKNEDQNVQQSS